MPSGFVAQDQPSSTDAPTPEACVTKNQSHTSESSNDQILSNADCPDPDSHFICVGDPYLEGGYELAKGVSTSLDELILCTPQAYGADGSKVCLECVGNMVPVLLTNKKYS